MPSATKIGSLGNHKNDDYQNFKKQYAICTMTSFYYYDQNPSGFCFLVLIKAFVYSNLTEITKFKFERKNEKDSGKSTEMTPSGKWPIGSRAKTTAVHVHHSF